MNEKSTRREALAEFAWETHRRRQAVRGLEMTPAERLRWLESTMETFRRWLGRARADRG